MIKRAMVRGILAVMCLFVWLPLFLMAGNSLMGEGEMLERFAAVFGVADRPVRAALLPSYPTLRPYVELLLDSPGFYVMFWNSCLQTGLAVAGQLLVALPAAWAFGALSFKGRRKLFLLYIILMLQPFQVTMAPSYLVLKRLSLLNSHLAVILPAAWSAFPVFIIAKFFETVPKPLLEAARLDGAGNWMIFWRVGVPLGKPGIVSAVVLGFLEAWNAIEQPMTFLKERRLWPLSLYLPEITADKAAVAWAASAVAMILPVSLFLMGQGALEQGIAAAGIKE
ncbi:MAG: carbohydrate ABC transporter permease [Enterocloster asparagiformis]|nr:carbohydrate ABC transporter permease [Enterocloster asparagiformis]